MIEERAEGHRVGCIILNWNGWQDTIECLGAFAQCGYPDRFIVVVDNGSTNDSVVRIRAAYPDVFLIESGSNLGFAGGNNIGIRYALDHGADYIWLLNNDTKPAPTALSALVVKAESDENIGAVASICYYASDPLRTQVWAGARVNLWLGYARNSTTPHKDEWFDALYGASMLVKRQATEDVGLLDSSFFLYWEETEYCLRLRKHGWRLAAAPDSRVLHKVNASTGGNKTVLDRYFTESGLRLLRKYAPMPWLSMVLFLGIRIVRRILRFEFSRIGNIWAGVRDYIAAPAGLPR